MKQKKYVYFIQAKESRRIKIGFSTNPERRFNRLKTGSPEPLELVLAVEESEHITEKILHEKFEYLNAIREWFEDSAELDEFIKDLKTNKDHYYVMNKEAVEYENYQKSLMQEAIREAREEREWEKHLEEEEEKRYYEYLEEEAAASCQQDS